MKIIVLSLIGILLISMSSYSFSQSNYVPGLTVTTNDKSYDEGDTIVISGKVSSVIDDTPIIIQLWKDSDIIDISQMNPDQDACGTSSCHRP